MKKIKKYISALAAVIGFILMVIAVGEGDAGAVERLYAIFGGFALILVPWLLRTVEELR